MTFFIITFLIGALFFCTLFFVGFIALNLALAFMEFIDLICNGKGAD